MGFSVVLALKFRIIIFSIVRMILMGCRLGILSRVRFNRVYGVVGF